MSGRSGIAALLAFLALASGWPSTQARAEPIHTPAASFERLSPLAANREIAIRMLSPLDAERVRQALDAQVLAVPEQTIDLASERFSVFVPDGPPPAAGYGLLVWVSPIDSVGTPAVWRDTLAHHRVIHVVAHRAGNDQDMIGRRIPLALHAVENVRRIYPVDGARTWVGGFSGGSRTAMRLALSYPDVFRGAILNAGADSFGNASIAVPPAHLFRRFQRESRIVMVTGTRDVAEILDRDRAFRRDARRFCVRSVTTLAKAGAGHERMNGLDLDRALKALSTPLPDPAADNPCDRSLAQSLEQSLIEAEAASAAGDRANAARLLSRLDERYGGLAGDRLLRAAGFLLSPPTRSGGQP